MEFNKTQKNKVENAASAIKLVRQQLGCNVKILWKKDIKTLESLLFPDKFIPIAIDTETLGTDVFSDKIVGLSFCQKGSDTCYYVPINHKNMLTEERIEEQFTEDELRDVFYRHKDKCKFIFHNGKFDIQIINVNLGVELKNMFDTMICQAILDENNTKSLKDLIKRYLCPSIASYSYKALFGKISLEMLPVEIVCDYAAVDAYATINIFDIQIKELKKPENKELLDLLMNLEMPLNKVVIEMERRGVNIDLKLLKKLQKEYGEKLEKIENKLHEEVELHRDKIREKELKINEPILLTSPAQISCFLYDCLGYKQYKGNSSDTPTLNILYNNLTTGKEFIKLLLDYRELKKIQTTYLNMDEKISGKDKKIHCSWNQIEARTGRFSSSGPNLQNIPSRKHGKIRNVFIADKGRVFISSDFKAQEPRLLAHFSNEDKLIKAYKEKRDVYCDIAAMIHNCDYKDCTEFYPDGTPNKEGKQRRSLAKTAVLAVMYGQGDNSMAELIKQPPEKARQIKEAFFNSYPKIREWIAKVKQNAKKDKFIKTISGRTRHLDVFGKPNFVITDDEGNFYTDDAFIMHLESTFFMDRPKIIDEYVEKYSKKLNTKLIIKDYTGLKSIAERQSVNSIIQGSAADITKKAMLLISKDKDLRDLDTYIEMTIHDEIICSSPEENYTKAAKIIRDLMISAYSDVLTVPMDVDQEISKRWYGKPFINEKRGKSDE